MQVQYTYKAVNIDQEFVKAGLLQNNETIKKKHALVKTDKGWIHEKLWSE